MFVQLRWKHPDETLVPPYDVDLIWQAHQLCTQAYQQDTRNYLGMWLSAQKLNKFLSRFVRDFVHSVFHTRHNPSHKLQMPVECVCVCFFFFAGKLLCYDQQLVFGVVDDPKRRRAESKTKRLWYQQFKVPLWVPGTSFRGDPPNGTMSNFDQQVYDASTPKGGLLTIEAVDMKLKDKTSGKFECLLSLFHEKDDGSIVTVLNDVKLGKGFKVIKGQYLWDSDTEYKGKLPVSRRVALGESYTLCLTVIKRGGLKGLIGSKEFQR